MTPVESGHGDPRQGMLVCDDRVPRVDAPLVTFYV